MRGSTAPGAARSIVEGQDHPGPQAGATRPELARNHALVDGDKRLALAGVVAFYGMNGHRLSLTNDEAYQLVMSVAAGELDDVPSIASELNRGTVPRA